MIPRNSRTLDWEAELAPVIRRSAIDRYPGCDRTDESLPWLQPGDVLESEVEGVGILRNTIVAQ